jgi:type IV pilus assembly protein PilA
MINGFNFRNRSQGQKGFTLVEVIVVAIIVAALAAVAIPLYSSYVASSRRNAVANTTGSVASFCGACRNAVGVAGITNGAVATGGGNMTCTIAAGNTNTIQIPPEIIITYVAPANATAQGSITGTHTQDATATATYNF